MATGKAPLGYTKTSSEQLTDSSENSWYDEPAVAS